jgi:hypothetical protein
MQGSGVNMAGLAFCFDGDGHYLERNLAQGARQWASGQQRRLSIRMILTCDFTRIKYIDAD